MCTWLCKHAYLRICGVSIDAAVLKQCMHVCYECPRVFEIVLVVRHAMRARACVYVNVCVCARARAIER